MSNSTPKVIFVPYSGHEHDQPALEYALQLAKTYRAHIEGWHIAPDPMEVAMSYAGYNGLQLYSAMDIRKMGEENEARRKMAEEKFLAVVKKTNAGKASFHWALGRAETVIAEKGRLSDLIVLSSSDENIDMKNTANGALFGSGRPVILVPPRPVKAFNGKVLIAWNGSREAAHAVSFALPYLAGKTVWVLTEDNEKYPKFPSSAEDLARYLQHHDIEAQIADSLKMDTQPMSILKKAKILDVDMIVMGAWSHSRLREYVLGGVTDFMLDGVTIPVFMAH